MIKSFFIFILVAFPLFLFSQNISVKSFRLLDNDLDALVNYPEVDQSNGEKAALIKIVTTITGFEFGGGQLGIVKVVQKTAEVWVYVPAKLKAITIAHPKLGQLANRYFNFEIPIVSGKVYEMVLVTGTIETIVKPNEIVTQWLAINSRPEGANVFIEDQLVGTTPFSRKYPEGEYSYRIELPRYNLQAGKINLSGERKVLDIILKPHFGNIKVTSTPENGMIIYLNDENTGKTTPATLEGIASGEHTLKLMNQWYQPQSKRITVNDEQTSFADFNMTQAYSEIEITTNPVSDILIDGKKVGNGNFNTRMLAGIYTIKAEKEKHYSDQKQVTVVTGNKQTIAFNLKPIVGSIDITSSPIDATITLNDKEYSTTPNTIKDLLIGNYTLTLKKIGFGIITKTVTINENSTTEVNETLPTGMEITIASTPAGKTLSIDGSTVGITPYKTTLGYGNHTIKIVNGKRVIEENIEIIQNSKNNFVFDVSEIAIGQPYHGGIIAYIFQPGDPGYISGEVHGLIAGTSLQKGSIWSENHVLSNTGVKSTTLGSGKANTTTLVNIQRSWAAQQCSDLVIEGYSDWYLPSKDELNKLFLNKDQIGGFKRTYYWSSSEFSTEKAWVQNFEYGYQSSSSKNNVYTICAISYF